MYDLDHFLNFFIVIAPFLFALLIEVVSERIRRDPIWRVGVVTFGVILSFLTWRQMSRQDASAKDAANAEQGKRDAQYKGLQSQYEDLKLTMNNLIPFLSRRSTNLTAEEMARIIRSAQLPSNDFKDQVNHFADEISMFLGQRNRDQPTFDSIPSRAGDTTEQSQRRSEDLDRLLNTYRARTIALFHANYCVTSAEMGVS